METHKHFKIHKPWGCISQFVNNKTRPKQLLSELHDFPDGTMAVGRLDVKSEGLLFLTTDGKFSSHICSGKFEKEYWVQVDGLVSDESLENLRNGVEISIKGEAFQTDPCKVERLTEHHLIPPNPRKERDASHGPMDWLKITIRQGKYRQVRKMTATQGHGTIRLIRWRIGDTVLGDMKAGEVKVLSNVKNNFDF